MNRPLDLAIIGGGPAGSSCAYHAARLGLNTLVLEKETYPREKPCGGGLTERTLTLLGARAQEAVNCKVEEARLYAPSFKYFVSKNIPCYFVLRRAFDHAMALDARDAGAEVMENAPVTGITSLPGGGYDIHTAGSGAPFKAACIAIASGCRNHSFIKELGIPRRWQTDSLAACRVSETAVENSKLQSLGIGGPMLGVFFGAVPNGYGWYFVKDGYINIGIGAPAHRLKQAGGPRKAYLAFVENLRKEKLLPADLSLAPEQPCPLPFKKTVEQSVFGRVLLLGDAASFVSPVTGEGLYYAVKSGRLAAEAFHRHVTGGTPLQDYQVRWTRAFGDDLNRFGYPLRERVYRSPRRLEFGVTLGRHDEKMAGILNGMVYGLHNYRRTRLKLLTRLPVALLKTIF